MTLHLGNIPAGITLYIPFSSYEGATGKSLTMSGFATSDILIYKNGSVTQRSSTAGFTLLDTDGTDFDGLTGIHGFSIDLSDNTDAGFYAAGSWYWVVISSVTIDAQTVSFVAATFRIVAAEGISGTPKSDVGAWNGTAVATPDTAGYPKVTIKDGTGTGEIDTTSGGVLVSTLATQAKADVNAEVVDALNVDTYAEPGQEAPGATVSLAKKINYLYKAWRNRHTTTDTTYKLYGDDAATVDQKATVSDDGTTFERTEIATGP